MNISHALLFNLDGTLADTVYAHVLAWQIALREVGVYFDDLGIILEPPETPNG